MNRALHSVPAFVSTADSSRMRKLALKPCDCSLEESNAAARNQPGTSKAKKNAGTKVMQSPLARSFDRITRVAPRVDLVFPPATITVREPPISTPHESNDDDDDDDQNSDAGSLVSEFTIYSESDVVGADDKLSSILSRHLQQQVISSGNVSVCNILVMDDLGAEDSPCWFRIHFDQQENDYVELEGIEALDFCRTVTEYYTASWMFEVTLESSGVATTVEGLYILDTLEVFLSLAATNQQQRNSGSGTGTLEQQQQQQHQQHERMPWQVEWVLYEESDFSVSLPLHRIVAT